ncbi:hypothetical protein RHS01_11004 [Rhizoctonia solani]|uniref:Uncharacterized protein n=1 Tax=Rhizoctonia solani TaxID=456999 RepID=A0A8H7I493_9AGAM|nr:hypothetical protein RHS01_11004 [Rhizoctonia solani]
MRWCDGTYPATNVSPTNQVIPHNGPRICLATTVANFPSPPSAPSSSSSTSTEALATALSQPPPPTLREILSAYAAQGRGDRDMLIALLKAKAAEDQRITNVAKLQQQVLQVQLAALGAQLQQNLPKTEVNSVQPKAVQDKSAGSTRDGRRSPVSPTPPKRYRSSTPVHVRAHPYAHARTPSREKDKSFWAVTGRGIDANVSDERSTSDESGAGH